jgi:hypothetical protein
MKSMRIARAATSWYTNAWPIEATDGYSADGRVCGFSIPNVA